MTIRKNGAYFVTICSHNRECLLGQIKNNAMHLNDAGRTAFDVWRHLPDHYFHVQLDQFVVMPNHIHGIVVLNRDVGAGFVRAGFCTGGFETRPYGWIDKISCLAGNHPRIQNILIPQNQ